MIIINKKNFTVKQIMSLFDKLHEHYKFINPHIKNFILIKRHKHKVIYMNILFFNWMAEKYKYNDRYET